MPVVGVAPFVAMTIDLAPPPSRVQSRQRARDRMLRRRRRSVLFAVLAATALLVGVDLARGAARTAGREQIATVRAPEPSAIPEADFDPTPSAAPSATRRPGAPTPSRTAVVDRGAGTFTVAPGTGAVHGTGTLMRYRVEVEDGIGAPPAGFAAAVDGTLGDRRSWTAGGRWSFQRVSAGQVDLVVRLASPKTVDRLCYPLDTNSYTSCRTGNTVVVNLARWLLGVPDYGGNLVQYRVYVVNHEVGHRLGQAHVACPGAGRLAPVMQQQTLGLRGCRPNPWPYVAGQLLTGPPIG